MIDQVGWNWCGVCKNIPASRIGRFEIIKDKMGTSLVEHSDTDITWMGIADRDLGTYLRFYHMAKGRVLIAGLGLGLDLLSAECNNNVGSITVVEKERDVIDLVWPYLVHNKTSVVHDDIFNYLLYTDSIFDTIYLDIFPGGCESNPIPTNELRVLAQPLLAPDGHLLFWYNL